MAKLFYVALFIGFALMAFLNCDTTVKPKEISKNDLVGTWSEADTSMGSESWSFSDSTVGHVFKDMDTIGRYLSWRISNDSIILTNLDKNIEIVIFNKVNNSKMNLKYYRWRTLMDKDFYKNN